MELKEKKCVPCEGGIDPLTEVEVIDYLEKVSDGWRSRDNHQVIVNKFEFENFRQGMRFANQIAEIAEQENHHPDLCVHYDSVEVAITTHAIGGLSENDFILAAKIDAL